jgi:predicted nucleic acid-binding protein
MKNKQMFFTKIIADTCIWIKFLKNNPQYFNIMQEMLEKRNIAAVECIFGELLQGSKSERERDLIMGYWDCLPKLNEENIWFEAGKYAGKNSFFEKGVGLIDSVIIVLAKKNNLKIWTSDKKLKALLEPDNVYFF